MDMSPALPSAGGRHKKREEREKERRSQVKRTASIKALLRLY
jgi:hypothetical protein